MWILKHEFSYFTLIFVAKNFLQTPLR
jgi:hypothetical protein